MTKIVNGEAPFQMMCDKFAINGANTNAYTLQYSVDGVFWSDAASVDANTQAIILNSVEGMHYRLSGNTTDLTIIY